MFTLYHKAERWHSQSIYSLGTKQLAYLLFYINRCFEVQLCSCLATAAEGKHELTATIPTLFLVLEALPWKCCFFLLSKPDSFQHFFKAATNPFHSFQVRHQKLQVLPSCSLPQSSVTSKSWNIRQGSIQSLFLPHRNQRENISLWFPTELTSV